MHADSRYLRVVGQLTLLSAALAIASLAVGAMAVEFDFDAFSYPTRTLAYAEHHALMFWFAILDMFGYYLLLLPVVLQQHLWLRERSSWAPLITLSGVAYAIIGAVGAAVLAAVWPDLLQQLRSATADDQAVIAYIFTTVTTAVTKGLWNILEMVFAALWWIGAGLLQRVAMPLVGWLSVATGTSCLLDLVGNLGGVEALSAAGLNLYLVLAIVWAVAIGVHLLRATPGQPPTQREAP